MKLRNLSLYLAAFYLSSLSIISAAQVAATVDTGPLPFHAYSGGKFDHIQMQNGSLFFQIPLFEIPQLGGTKMSFSIRGQSSSRIPQSVCGATCQYYFVAPQLGTAALSRTSGEFYSITGAQIVHDQAIGLEEVGQLEATGIQDSYGFHPSYAYRRHFSLQEGNGTRHAMGYDATDYSSLHAVDGSGWTLKLPISNTVDAVFTWDSSSSNPIAYDADGIKYEIGNNVSTMRDPFGNTISGSQTNGFVDSIAHSIPSFNQTPIDPSGCPNIGISDQVATSSVLWSVPGPNGATSAYRFCYTSVALKTNYWGGQGNDICDYILVPDPSGNGNFSQELECWQEQHGESEGLQSVVLPDNSYWAFIYDSSQAGAQYTYGDIVEIRTPEGGRLDYTYGSVKACGESEPGPGGTFTPVVRSIFKRTVSSGSGADVVTTYQYAPTKTTETTNGSDIEHFFTLDDPTGVGCGANETTTKYWQGSANGGSVLKQVDTTFSSTVSPQDILVFGSPGAYIPSPKVNSLPIQVVTQVTGQATSTVANNFELHFTDVDPINSLGATPPYYFVNLQAGIKLRVPIQKTDAAKSVLSPSYFGNYPSYKTANLLNLRASTEILDNNGLRSSFMVFHYDENNGSPQGTLGQLTSTDRWLGSTFVTTSTIFNSQGMLTQTNDARGMVAKVNSFQCGGLFRSSVTKGYGTSIAQTTSETLDCNTGAILQSTDPNNMSIIYERNDPLDRVTKIRSAADTASESNTVISYPSRININIASDKSIKGDGLITRSTTYDGLGRLARQIDPAGLIVDTKYDNEGNVSSISNPYRATPIAGDAPLGTTTYTYDALGRLLYQCQADNTPLNANTCQPNNSYLQWQYQGDALIFFDENRNSSQRTSDALGRLTKVVESGNSETDYVYNALGNLTCVEQHGGSSGTGCSSDPSNDVSSPWRVRRFTYDSLSRITSSTNPETGTILYSHDPNGNLIQKTSPSPNQASGTTTLGYCYDALNRMTAKFYGSPNCTSPSSGALVASYAYDTSTITGAQNTIGRLTSESSIADGVAYSQRLPYVYDAMGRIKNERQCPLLPCATPNELQYTYDLSGNVTSSNNGVPNSGTPQIGWTNSYDAAGRLAKLQSTWDDATHPAVLFEADQTINGITPYGPFGLTAAQHGISPATPQNSLLAETRAYDIRGRLTLKQVNTATVGSPSVPVITLSPMPLHLGAVGTATMSIVCPSMCGTMFWWVDGIYKGGAGVYDGGNISFYVGSDLSLGSHTLTVHYNGNGTIPASDSTPFTFSVINPAVTPEPISLILTPSSITLGTSTTAAISLPCGSNCTTGQLLIDGVRVAGTGFDAAGTARLSVGSSLTMGIHTATFAYNGDALYSPNSISTSLTVIPPTVTISPMSLQLGATAKGTMGVTCITMCGTMGWFVDGVYKGGSGVDDGGNISFLFGSDLGLGSHILTVHYNGNGTSQASDAEPINFNVVSPAAVPEPMTISISPATITQGGSSIVVVDLACGSSCNSGNLLVDGVRVAGTNFDATGAASLTIGSTLSQGTHIVTMVYPGDAAYAPNSATANLVVTSP